MAMPYTPGTGSKLGELLGIWDTDTLTTFLDMVLPLFSDQSNIEVKHLRRKMITTRTKVRLVTFIGNFFQQVTKRVSQPELK